MLQSGKLGPCTEDYYYRALSQIDIDVLTSNTFMDLTKKLGKQAEQFLECFILVASHNKETDSFIVPLGTLLDDTRRSRLLANLILESPDNIAEGSKFITLVQKLQDETSRLELLANETSRKELLAKFITLVQKLPDETSRLEFFERLINAADNKQNISEYIASYKRSRVLRLASRD